MTRDQIETCKLIIEGMDCRDEVNSIEKKLKEKNPYLSGTSRSLRLNWPCTRTLD